MTTGDDAVGPSANTDVYTHGHDRAVLRSHTWRTVDNSAAYLAPQLGAGSSLLDVGCGPATLTVDLARRVAPGHVVGIDVASILATAQATVDAASDAVDVELREGDVYRLQFDDGSFDVVHAHQVLQHLSDPVAALREMHRVCRPGGLVAARDSDYGAFRWWPAAPALDAWLELYHEVTRANGAEADAGRHLLAWASAAGLSEVTLTSSTWVFATPEERSWWAGLWSERIAAASTFGRRAIELGAATASDLAELSEGWLAWAAHDDACFFVPHGEFVVVRT